MNKLISVIMPVRNVEKYLQEALDGIKSQGMNVEIILVDDVSSDGTAEIAQNAGCHIIKHDVCKGPAAGKNTGLGSAKGEYILFHDGDDVMREGVLVKMYAALEADSSISAVMAKVQNFLSPDVDAQEVQHCVIQKEPFYGLFTGAILIRKSIFDKIGLFEEKIAAGDIIAWKIKMDTYHLLVKKLDFVSTDRRIHNSNYGRTMRKEEFKDYTSILRAKMLRK